MFDPSLYIQILHEDFNASHAIVENEPSIWRLNHRWDNYIFNSPLSFHTNQKLVTNDGKYLNMNAFFQEDGVFMIAPFLIPSSKKPDVENFLTAAGATQSEAQQVTHATGMISLHDSWAQTYGYFEITARMPQGAGHWPALWLAPATKGWPPEIDIIEVAGAKHREGGPPSYQSAVHFDALDPTGDAITNPLGALQTTADGKLITKPDRWFITKDIYPDLDIFAEFVVYGLEWTPDQITWSIGPDSDHMQTIFTSPTPPDLHSPLYFIANTEVGGQLGGEPPQDGLIPDALEIDDIKIFAPADQQIIGTPDSDDIIANEGFEIITTHAGDDKISTARTNGNKVITDFSRDDQLLLTDFPTIKMFQTGKDVWITSPGDPFNPVTIILKDVMLGEIAPDQIQNN